MRILRALAVAALLLVTAAPVSATPYTSPGYEYRPQSFGGVVDLSCDGVHTFEMIVYYRRDFDGGDGGGGKLKLCSVEDDLCDVQMGNVIIPNGCGGESGGTTFHNTISSFKILSHPTSIANGGDWCIVVYDARYYNTQNAWPFGFGKRVYFGTEQWAYIGDTTNDRWSSIKRTTAC